MIALGDMTLVAPPPAKLAKALAVIADTLHPTLSAQPWIAGPDQSKQSCVLCSLAVRDFLRAIGYTDARVRPTKFVIKATRNGEQIHSLGIGMKDAAPRGFWNGHLVVTIPSLRWLIDTTLYQAIRPAWADVVKGMMALPVPKHDGGPPLWGYRILVGISAVDGDYECALAWLADPRNTSWRNAPDVERDRRVAVVGAMIERFYPWSDA